ncbi:uncharacterized protein LOC141900263 [Tubulanus polymorphus]|uniref:uncharacterized protein LOC141900263 n=1 Tax=Tubulanus polymorphus TaxID=672921 RepID=UPI003DA61DBD
MVLWRRINNIKHLKDICVTGLSAHAFTKGTCPRLYSLMNHLIMASRHDVTCFRISTLLCAFEVLLYGCSVITVGEYLNRSSTKLHSIHAIHNFETPGNDTDVEFQQNNDRFSTAVSLVFNIAISVIVLGAFMICSCLIASVALFLQIIWLLWTSIACLFVVSLIHVSFAITGICHLVKVDELLENLCNSFANHLRYGEHKTCLDIVNLQKFLFDDILYPLSIISIFLWMFELLSLYGIYRIIVSIEAKKSKRKREKKWLDDYYKNLSHNITNAVKINKEQRNDVEPQYYLVDPLAGNKAFMIGNNLRIGDLRKPLPDDAENYLPSMDGIGGSPISSGDEMMARTNLNTSLEILAPMPDGQKRSLILPAFGSRPYDSEV